MIFGIPTCTWVSIHVSMDGSSLLDYMKHRSINIQPRSVGISHIDFDTTHLSQYIGNTLGHLNPILTPMLYI